MNLKGLPHILLNKINKLDKSVVIVFILVKPM